MTDESRPDRPEATPEGAEKKPLVQRDPETGKLLPGASLNPGGRPAAEIEVRTLARAKTPEAIETLVAIMLDAKQPARVRVLAAAEILDRGWGRVFQAPAGPATNVQVNVGLPPGRTLSPQEAYALMIGTTSPDETRALIERVERPVLGQEVLEAEVVPSAAADSAAPRAPGEATREVLEVERDPEREPE